MRWKLLFIITLLTAIVGTAACMVMIYGFLGSTVGSLRTAARPALYALLIPVAATTFAAVFVYRHTSRRRALQATITVFAAILLTLGAVYVASRFLNNP